MKMWKLSATDDTVSDCSGEWGGGALPVNVIIPPPELEDLDLRFVRHEQGVLQKRTTVQVAAITSADRAAAEEKTVEAALQPVILALLEAINKRIDKPITIDEIKVLIKAEVSK